MTAIERESLSLSSLNQSKHRRVPVRLSPFFNWLIKGDDGQESVKWPETFNAEITISSLVFSFVRVRLVPAFWFNTPSEVPMMKLTLAFLVTAFIGVSADAQQDSDAPLPAQSEQKGQPVRAPAAAKQDDDDEEQTSSKLAVLTDEDLDELLGRRLNGQLGMTFGGFLKVFLVQSRLSVGTGIALLTNDKKIIRSELQPCFLESYKPTLRELLDSIALQTFSEWKYDREKQFVRTEKVQDKPVEGLVNFHFQRIKRKKPYRVTLAENWKAEDKGHWMMYIPPNFPVGMDIYEFGRYSTKQDDKKAFFESIRTDVALEWAQRVNPETSEEDLKPANVGTYEALFYERLLKGNGKKMRWRQWVFMVEDRCFFIVSTIPPNLEDEIFPDVKAMIESFKMED
jgi:hypothetical protein